MSKQVSRLGPYEIVSMLARSESAQSISARFPAETRFERLVAVKVLGRELSDSDTFREQLIQEARATSELNHINIAQTWDVAERGGFLYLVLEYVEGRSLRDLMGDGTAIPGGIAAFITSEICGALSYAHARPLPDGGRGLVHGDIRPRKIIISHAGAVKIADFAVSRARRHADFGEASSGTAELEYYQFSAPEVLDGEGATTQSDVFSAALVGFQLLTGRSHYSGMSADQIRAEMSSRGERRVHQFAPEVDTELAEIIERGLRLDPNERGYPNAQAMRSALTGWLRRTIGTFGRHKVREFFEESLKTADTARTLRPLSRREFVPLDPASLLHDSVERDVPIGRVGPSILFQLSAEEASSGEKLQETLARATQQTPPGGEPAVVTDDEPEISSDDLDLGIPLEGGLGSLSSNHEEFSASHTFQAAKPQAIENDDDDATPEPSRSNTSSTRQATQAFIPREAVEDFEFEQTLGGPIAKEVANARSGKPLTDEPTRIDRAPRRSNTDLSARTTPPKRDQTMALGAPYREETEAMVPLDDAEPLLPRSQSGSYDTGDETVITPNPADAPKAIGHAAEQLGLRDIASDSLVGTRPTDDGEEPTDDVPAWVNEGTEQMDPVDTPGRGQGGGSPYAANGQMTNAELDQIKPPGPGFLPWLVMLIVVGALAVGAWFVYQEYIVGEEAAPLTSQGAFITSRPQGATIFIDDAEAGVQTPANIDLPALDTTYRVHVEFPGYETPVSEAVTASSSERISVDFELNPLPHAVRAEADVEGTEVYVDGELVGTVPVDLGAFRLDPRSGIDVTFLAPNGTRATMTHTWDPGSGQSVVRPEPGALQAEEE